MPSGLQLAILAGGLVGLGVALIVWRLTPADPDLGDALKRLSPSSARSQGDLGMAGADSGVGSDARERLGLWGMKTLPAGAWGSVPVKELAILRIPVSRFYGEKLMFAGLGLLAPPLLATFFTLLRLPVPVVIPVIASLGAAVVFFFLPDYNARDDAKKARAEFARALGAYIDLVALERNSGAGPRQAMEAAADVGDSWVFRRLGEELARTRWSGLTPWDALRNLADELGLPELQDLADIMRLSGEEGAQIYSNLRARSAGMRAAMLGAEKTKANEVGERMSIPMSLLGVIFLAILVAPALLRVMGDS
ncbi:type II secretion system F family protein [Terrabacter carboxydivorans]|uniref:Type II secretion system protein GspF domain-containing protein n=1 Tax=Terrabacter carboxydivorans TaxID=619730 RepID=A0ABN3KQF0_9MICO